MTTPPLATLTDAAATIAAYGTAVQLGILDRIDREPADIDEIAASCGVSERGTRLLMTALSAIGLVQRLPDGRYQAAAAGLAALHPTLDMWRHLPQAVRDGTPALRADTVAGASQLYPSVVPHLAQLNEAAAARAAQLLPPARDILDVGAGAAPWSLPLAARDPDCRITALDLPAVLPTTQRAVEGAGRTEQYRYLPGDVFDIDLPRHVYDLILLGNFCHLFEEATNQRLMLQLSASLRPDGVLAILGFIPPPTPAAQPSPLALYELSLLLRTRNDCLYATSAYDRWLTDAGFGPATPVAISTQPPITLITARNKRPARPMAGTADS